MSNIEDVERAAGIEDVERAPEVELRVVKGAPTPEELAALVVALRLVRPAADAPRPAVTRPRRVLRRPLVPGPRGWRESSWNLGGHL
ncbi:MULTISPECIES: acyl-CoA carboxylase subunit epsilon [unclassified Nonomuraea]|uniref:acyl-CoA carboxylase subunit epsilon n=1 Tax=unclassified Nonomuraea TaxID=2593643 RepID=UPI0033E4EF53